MIKKIIRCKHNLIFLQSHRVYEHFLTIVEKLDQIFCYLLFFWDNRDFISLIKFQARFLFLRL